MNYIKSFSEFVNSHINESKSVEEKIKDIARHLSFDKDVIAYLNTSRSKRKMGWRDFLDSKLHGDNKNYITYLTKNMVADYNPQITGPEKIVINDEGDFDNPNEIQINNNNNNNNNIDKRVENIEDTLGIDPDNEETIDSAKKKMKKLGFDPIYRDEDGEIIDNEEEE